MKATLKVGVQLQYAERVANGTYRFVMEDKKVKRYNNGAALHKAFAEDYSLDADAQIR